MHNYNPSMGKEARQERDNHQNPPNITIENNMQESPRKCSTSNPFRKNASKKHDDSRYCSYELLQVILLEKEVAYRVDLVEEDS